jgi:ABC-type amino acid transport substrate-binding protein
MKARIVLVALVAAVTLTSVAAASPDATKQRVVISSKLFPEKTFVLTPFKTGAVKRDSGTIVAEREAPSRNAMRDGQKVTIFDGQVWKLTGKRGTLTIRERTEWVSVSDEVTSYGYPPGVATGTWKVVRGTGQYVRISGSGRSGHAGFGSPWLAQLEGFLTSP